MGIVLFFLWRALRSLLALALLVPILLALVLAITPFLIPIWVIGLALFVSPSFRAHVGVTWLGYVLFGLWWVLLLPVMAIPFIALALAAALHLHAYQPQQLAHFADIAGRYLATRLPSEAWRFVTGLEVSWPEAALTFCLATGIAGVAVMLVHALLEIPWRVKQIRQARTLPRSKIRSAALGLAEFEGIARMIPSPGGGPQPKSDVVPPFLLEDETGMILVDPRGATVRHSWVAGLSLELNEVEHGIRDGDRVYVLGNVQRRDAGSPGAPGSDRLVVRPLKQTLVSSPVGRLLFPKRHQPADRDAPNIFLVDKGGEHGVIRRLQGTLWDFCFSSAIYLAASLWLVWTAWPWVVNA